MDYNILPDLNCLISDQEFMSQFDSDQQASSPNLFLSPYSPISPAPFSDYFKVETPTPADYKDDDVFKSDNEQEEREKALLEQLDQLTSDTKPDVKT